jgi:uncharacterized protein involved in response to NO
VTREEPEAAPRPVPALLLQPYRAFFLCGASYALIAVAFWFVWLEALRVGAPLPLRWNVAPGRVHALAMIWGVLTFYVFGFLLTAYVRWVQAAPPSTTAVIRWIAVLVAGHAAIVVGALGPRWLIVPGGLLVLAALLGLIAFLGRAWWRSATTERLQPAVVLIALALGALGLALAIAGLDRGGSLYPAGILLGTYGYLMLLLTSVAHRLVPFFTALRRGQQSGTRRRGTLPVLCLGLALRGCVAALGDAHTALRVAASVDAVLFATLAWEVSAWSPRETLREPMIAVLYLAQVWLLAALAGSAVSWLFPARAVLLDLPVLHALAIGGLGTMVVGISTRVALGHAGRPIEADAWLLAVFALVQLAALLRVGFAFAGSGSPAAGGFAHWAALPWCLAFAIWLARLGPLLVRRP